jgi:hypothetical protein
MSNAENSAPKQRGRPFPPGQSGNPAGKPKGARHAALKALDAIGADGAADVMAAVVRAAKEGDMRAAEILLRRLWPERRGRPVPVALPPITDAAALVNAVAAITAAVGEGELSPEEGQAVAAILETQRRAIETVELDQRITALEARSKDQSR